MQVKKYEPNNWDFEDFKEIIKKILELNIAIKNNNKRHCEGNDELYDNCIKSIEMSYSNLKKVDDIPSVKHCVFLLNHDMKMWKAVNMFCGMVNGTLGDNRFYEKKN